MQSSNTGHGETFRYPDIASGDAYIAPFDTERPTTSWDRASRNSFAYYPPLAPPLTHANSFSSHPYGPYPPPTCPLPIGEPPSTYPYSPPILPPLNAPSHVSPSYPYNPPILSPLNAPAHDSAPNAYPPIGSLTLYSHPTSVAPSSSAPPSQLPATAGFWGHSGSSSSGELRPPYSGELRPPYSGELYSGELRPPYSGELRPPYSGELRPPFSGDLRPPHSGELTLQPFDKSLRYHLLYGTLHVHIQSATQLPNMDGFSETLRQFISVFDSEERPLPLIHGAIVQHTRKKITSDPYVSLVLKGATIARTRVISNNQNPVWNETFAVPVAHKVAEVELVVKDNDMVGAQYIGQVKIPAEVLMFQKISNQEFELVSKGGKVCASGAKLKISMEYCSVDSDPLYRDGVGAGPVYQGVPNTYFPLRTGGRMTLYQDAHIQGQSLPSVTLRGRNYGHRSCWEDICEAILDAQQLVYIAGWSVYSKIKLVRDRQKGWRKEEEAYEDLGQLLKAKALVAKVLLLVWDDKTSHAVVHKDGIMGTHDEETKKYFKNTKVRCLLSPRYADSKLSWVKQQVVGTLYTHHQKIVIVDAPVAGDRKKRHLVAFLGGLDLCDGRYDTPEHSLFRKLNTVFKDDYHNPTFPTKVDSGGPREPWHDLHCKIEGPAAYDILTNFEQRWRKTSKWHGFNFTLSKHRFHDDSLHNLEGIMSPQKHGMSRLHVTSESDPETWHVQVFRSIDSGSVKGFPKGPEEVSLANLVGRKNVAVDMSIHTAYVKAIRAAQHFIYIENQYFLGSSFAWPTYKNAGANHLVPIELALKIVSKIKAGKPFAVYVVIPMWPEGVPDSLAVQEILYFQSQTMEMMYTLIAEALKERKLDDIYHPTDFLQFFCLGNREVRGEDEPTTTRPPADGSTQARALKSRRFMIYVHAKGMIVDDEYVIIGSANINQRSMDGSRDTEIAMGAYQPYYTWAHHQGLPQGQVHGYRMSLWAEHFGVNERCFMEPWSIQCVKTVKDIAARYWKQYTAEEVTEMKGHMLPYPVFVEKAGKVSALPGFETFPDVGGKILGNSTTLPDELTC